MLRRSVERMAARKSARQYWRSLAWQLAVVAAALLVMAWMAVNAVESLQRQHIASGFDFLNETAGFGILQTSVHYTEESSYGRVLLIGTINTIIVAVISIVLATVLGFLIGIGRLSTNWLVSKVCAAYVETLRNIPLLLQILFWYFGVLEALPYPRNSVRIGEGLFILNNRGLYLPLLQSESGAWLVWGALTIGVAAALTLRCWAVRKQMATGVRPATTGMVFGILLGLPALALAATGIPFSLNWPHLDGLNFDGGLHIFPELAALAVALATYTAAYIAETVRAGLQSVSRGQREAAAALGLKPSLAVRLVLIPQAMRVIVPPLASEYLSITKNSSLAIAIGYPELVSVFAGTVLNQTGQAIEVITITMGVYLALSLLTSLLMNWYNSAQAMRGE